jgi:hypothetical protein
VNVADSNLYVLHTLKKHCTRFMERIVSIHVSFGFFFKEKQTH